MPPATAIETIWHESTTEAEWIATAKALVPQGGKLDISREYPTGPRVAFVHDRNGRIVARVGWKR